MHLLSFLPLAIFPGIGLIALISGLRAIAVAHRAEHWPSTDGTILASSVISYRTHSHGHSTTMFGARVRYSYNVDGRELQSNRVGFAPLDASWRTGADSVVRRFPAGATVRVHYDPKDPSEAALDTGLAPGLLIVPSIGIVFLLIGTMTALLWVVLP